MFAGHLAVALAAKHVEPEAPLGALVAASFGLDLLWPLLLLVGLACIYIVATTLRLSAQLHRGEAAALDLMGASRGFVRAPIIAEGILQGVFGAAIAAGLLWLMFRATAPAIAEALPTAFGPTGPAFLPAVDIVLLIGVGAGCGLIGSWLASGRRALA